MPAITIVNKTTYTNPGQTNSGSFSLASPSTAGNWLVAVVQNVGVMSSLTLTTDQGEHISLQGSVTNINSGTGAASIWLGAVKTTKSASTITFATQSFVWPQMIVYEVSGPTLVFGGAGFSQAEATGVTTYQSSNLTGSPTLQSIYFIADMCDGTITNVSPLPPEQDALAQQAGWVVTSGILNNTVGLQVLTYTLSPAADIAAVTLILSSNIPPPPPAPGCQVKDGGGNVLSTYIADLGLSISPATQLYEQFIPSSVIVASEYDTEGRTGIVMDFNSGDGIYSRDIETAFTWSISNRLVLYVWQPSLIPMPENQFNRPGDWDDGGTPGAKFIQGVIVEADSFNSAKSFELQSSDDLSLHALNEMPATFPKQTTQAFSCVTPFIAHSVRLIATDGVPWRVWKSNPVFQPWPEQTTNWQTEQTSFGMTGWLHAREMNIAYASNTPITVVLVFDAWPTITLQLPRSGGALVQAKTKVTLPANKFKLVSVQVLSTAPFYLFEGDLEFKVKAWGSTGPFSVLKVIGGPSKTGALV